MAIQFYCPYCTAAIRVPDTAAGKKGRCPKCETEVLVPRVKPPESRPASAGGPASLSPVESLGPQPASAAAKAGEQTATPGEALRDEPESAAPVPAIPGTLVQGTTPTAFPAPLTPPDATSAASQPAADVPFVTDRTHPVAARVRRRSRRSAARWLIPLICGAALAGVVIWLLQREQQLQGELPAEVAAGFEIPPRVIPPELLEVDAELREAMLTALEDDPERVISPGVMAVEFRGSSRGLEVVLEPAPASEVIRVRVAADPHLVAFRKEHARELFAARRERLLSSARDFCRDWQRAADAGVPLDASRYLVSLGLTASVKSLGFHVQAIARDKIYPCAFEDPDGSLYFVLPAGTSQFRLEGRKLSDGRTLFPGNYTVRIARQARHQTREK